MLAVDGDPHLNLAVPLGVLSDQAEKMVPVSGYIKCLIEKNRCLPGDIPACRDENIYCDIARHGFRANTGNNGPDTG